MSTSALYVRPDAGLENGADFTLWQRSLLKSETSPSAVAISHGSVLCPLWHRADPEARLFAFSPFLAILYNRIHFQKALWLSFLCGLIIDLLSSEVRLGVYALPIASRR